MLPFVLSLFLSLSLCFPSSQATHIFDGLESWPSHLAFFAGGEMETFKPSSEFPELKEGRLVYLVAKWLKAKEIEADRKAGDESAEGEGDPNAYKYLSNNGWGSGRSNMSIKLSSNAVWRC